MVIAKCPIENCDFQTDDQSDSLAGISLTIHANIHTTEKKEPSAIPKSRAERMQRPTVSSEISNEVWSYFKWSYDMYTRHANITEDEKPTELLACCDVVLRRNLFRANHKIGEATEEEILQAIQTLAVKSESLIVSQVNHFKMYQARDEPIQIYSAGVKGKASTCDYTTEALCECGKKTTVNYGDKVTRQIIIANMADSEIQKDLLGELNNRKSMSVEQVVNFIAARENGRESALKLSNYQHQNMAPASSYKKSARPQTKNMNQVIKPKNNFKEKCSNCGLYGHGNHWGLSNSSLRKKLGCPAYGKQCDKCQRMGHFGTVCRTTLPYRPTTAAAEEEDESKEYMVGGAVGISQY